VFVRSWRDEEVVLDMVDTLRERDGAATSQSRPAEFYTNDLVWGAPVTRR